MDMRAIRISAVITIAIASLFAARLDGFAAAEPPAKTTTKSAAPASAETDPALQKLRKLIGGTWKIVPREAGGGINAEMKYEAAFGGKGIKETALLAKGTPQETQVETFFGWDPDKKHAYYISFHGAETVYKGVVTAEGDVLVTRFNVLVGKPAEYEVRDTFTDADNIQSVFYTVKDGKKAELMKFQLRRSR
jgi:hypothetical protein